MSERESLRAARRLKLAAQMTWAYKGRFPRRKVWKLYWQMAGDMVRRG